VGFRRAKVLAAAFLLAAGVFILVEVVRRLIDPGEIASTAMIVFGRVGLVGTSSRSAFLPASGTRHNARGFLEVVTDALGSFAVLTAAALIAPTGLTTRHPPVSGTRHPGQAGSTPGSGC
jgi:cobalt-zinc-cadmium efflux system protein